MVFAREGALEVEGDVFRRHEGVVTCGR